MKSDLQNTEFQLRLEDAVVKYQNVVKTGNRNDQELAYKSVIRLYDPMNFHQEWYEKYHYLFDSVDDFLSDYLRVFATVLIGWKPKSMRSKSRYDGSGEFKNYFIGSLYHNYINMVKSDQAAKRNVTKQCPICDKWVNPISTHLITHHTHLLWEHLEETGIVVEELKNCPFCNNFKLPKNATDKSKITDLMKAHFVSKHTSMLFSKFNELFPGISTLSPKTTSVHVEEEGENLNLYDISEEKENLIDKLSVLNLSDTQKQIINNILNGENNLSYKSDKYTCTKDQWEKEMEKLKETMSIHGHE